MKYFNDSKLLILNKKVKWYCDEEFINSQIVVDVVAAQYCYSRYFCAKIMILKDYEKII